MAVSNLALDPETFRQLGYRAVDMATDHLAMIRDRPVYQPMTPGERADLLDQPLPLQEITQADVLDRFAATVLPFPIGNGHPRFFGWVNSPPAHLSVIAELLAAAMDPSPAGGDHAAIYVERAAVRWLMELVGFPTECSMGLLVSGGSMASLTCLAAARHRLTLRQGWNDWSDGMAGDHPPLVVYLSSEAHTTLHKAVELLGLGTQSLRVMPVDADSRTLKLWMTMQQVGRDGYVSLITRHNALAETLAGLGDSAHDLERLAPV